MPYDYQLTMSAPTVTQPQIKTAWIIGLLALLAVFVIIGWYSGRMTRVYPDTYAQRADERLAIRQKLDADANQTLTTADWVDQTKKIIRIPIDEAMAKEIDTLKAEPAQVGCEIPGVAPAPAAAPAAPTLSTNASPAAPAKPAPAAPAKPKK